MTFVAIVIFGAALAMAGYALAATVLPSLDKIATALRGVPQQPRFEPLASLVRAERRIAVRRWAAAPGRPTLRPREAA
ncbi:hypothetical protein [Sphingomonas adhaesiva]|uniref:hypothetical protein n=1 Tax=Sphingomonas adhaesiva TaxID=28212 RepID=UPI002FF5EBDE